jgi:hypothetical protein
MFYKCHCVAKGHDRTNCKFQKIKIKKEMLHIHLWYNVTLIMLCLPTQNKDTKSNFDSINENCKRFVGNIIKFIINLENFWRLVNVEIF